MDSITEIERQCRSDNEYWFPDMANNLVHHTLALCGETGELANVVKKAMRGSLDIQAHETQQMLAEEVTDCLIYMASIGAILGIDLGAAYDQKRQFNVERWGDPDTGTDGETGTGVLRPVPDSAGEGS